MWNLHPKIFFESPEQSHIILRVDLHLSRRSDEMTFRDLFQPTFFYDYVNCCVAVFEVHKKSQIYKTAAFWGRTGIKIISIIH